MCEGSNIYEKGKSPNLRKREIPEFTKKGNPRIYEKGKSPNLRKREIPRILKYPEYFI